MFPVIGAQAGGPQVMDGLLTPVSSVPKYSRGESDSGCGSYPHGTVDQLFTKALEAVFPTSLHVFVDLEKPDDTYPVEGTLGIWAGWTLTYYECNLGSLCSQNWFCW